MDTSPQPEDRSPFYLHLKAKGRMGRKNPELLRVSRVTGLSVEHLFHVALGRRVPSPVAAKAIVRAVPKGAGVTEQSFYPDPQE